MRSGKTRLSKHLQLEHSYNLIQTDHLILALQKAYPSTGVGKPGFSYESLCEAFSPFLRELLSQLAQDTEQNYIVEGYYIRPSDANELRPAFYPIFLGYPLIGIDQKIQQIRDYSRDHECYTSDFSDADLRGYVTRWIDQSRDLAQVCANARIPFFDTGSGIQLALNHLNETMSPLAVYALAPPASSQNPTRACG